MTFLRENRISEFVYLYCASSAREWIKQSAFKSIDVPVCGEKSTFDDSPKVLCSHFVICHVIIILLCNCIAMQLYYLVPNSLSPASPRPGTIYL